MSINFIIKKAEKIMNDACDALHLEKGTPEAEILDGVRTYYRSKLGFIKVRPHSIHSIGSGFYTDWMISKRYEVIEYFFKEFLEAFDLPETYHLHISTMYLRSLDTNLKIDRKNVWEPYLKFSDNKAGLQELEAITKELLYSELIDFGKRFDNIHFLNEYINSGIEKEKRAKRLYSTRLTGHFKKMIISKLAGGKYYDDTYTHTKHILNQIEELIIAKDEDYMIYQSHSQIFEELLVYLEQLEPMANPDLFSEENMKYIRS